MTNRLITCLAFVSGLATGLADGHSPAATGGYPNPSAVPAAPPALSIGREGSRLRLEFGGILESSTTLAGPWQALTNLVSPVLIDPAEGPGRFYRTRLPVDGSIFDGNTALTWTLTGPLQDHFDLALAGMPDGIIPPRREKPYFDARLNLPGLQLPVSLRVRGNSSLQECPFPKLKLKVSKENRAGTPFADAREIRIGSHCAEGGSGTVGRLRDERATYREAMVYELLGTLGFTAPRVRRATIEYRDTSPIREDGSTGWQVVRQALVLEDIEVVGERLGGRALEDEELRVLENAGFDPQLITDLRLFHALVGNWDYELSEDGRNLWNTDVLELPGGELRPVAGDFDLCSCVTGEVRHAAPHDYHPELGDVEREARYRVEQIRNGAGAQRFESGRRRFVDRRPAIETLVAGAEIDTPGRGNAIRHVTAFFDALTVTR